MRINYTTNGQAETKRNENAEIKVYILYIGICAGQEWTLFAGPGFEDNVA